MITLIYGPKVYLISSPKINWDEVGRFLEDEYKMPNDVPMEKYVISLGINDGVSLVEIAARLCYSSFGRGRTNIHDFIENLLSSKHGSVLEHVNYSFLITGVSRSLTHEVVRHRAGFGYSQRSQRYVDESGAWIVVPPDLIGMDEDKLREIYEPAIDMYDFLVEGIKVEKIFEEELSTRDKRKRIRQAGRSVLPNATETKYMVTGNVRAWRHFIELRASRHADKEIRRLAVMVHYYLKKETPILFDDFREEQLSVSDVELVPLHSKV